MRLSGKKGRLRVQHREDDFSPMEGVGNMADAMLVFACGLIVALIVSWNVNVTDQGIQKQPQDKYEVNSIEQSADTIEDESQLEEMGKVYRDPKTGKYFVVEK
ncbi:MAG: DUF2149 domain-containing protein [Clostridiales bacterium]|nr:DUF2149 domain-containing protein [Candidatus Crickella equi]